jgi:hypothetical protein
MPPVLAALIPVFVAIGASTGVGTPITPDLLLPPDPPAPDGDTLAVYGRAFQICERSTHSYFPGVEKPDGSAVNMGSMAIPPQGAEEFVQLMWAFQSYPRT